LFPDAVFSPKTVKNGSLDIMDKSRFNGR